ncbi:uncharacterized protein LOC136079899 [Hydra vulgaris]|uniref:Uncharacterized protein LOC136079899 n=1 Tax=Hydra vulgaris TaxID=6087 RepID=A0ABM4BU24_HYDVU
MEKLQCSRRTKIDILISRCCGEISHKIGSDWLKWGRHLGLSDSDLDNIDSDNKKCYDKADNVLKKWKQINGNLSWEQIKTQLRTFQRFDIVTDIEREFEDILSIQNKTSTIKYRIPHGCIFKFDLLDDEICNDVKFQLLSSNNANNWTAIIDKKQAFQYYLTKKKNGALFVKVENLMFENEKINFKFSFHDTKKTAFQRDSLVTITGNCKYELNYNNLFITTPEPIFNNDFSKDISLSSLEWRNLNNMYLDIVPQDKPIELFALDYFDRNFVDGNDVIFVLPSIADNGNIVLVVSKFFDLFTVNSTGIRAVFSGYRLRYHARLLKCDVEKFTNHNDENRIIIFCSMLNLIIIARIATTIDCIKLEYENCLNDVILFVNVNNPLFEKSKLIILGLVVLPLHNRKHLKEELFCHFSENFDLEQILFLCKDDIENKSFENWWRSLVAYCVKKVNEKNKNEMLFKKLISLTMISMAKVDHCYPTLEANTHKQIQSLILNVEQRNAINDKALKKIITGGYGSGKSIVGKEIVKNCITYKSKNPFTLYYICCNHFSLYECHMKEFVESLEKTSNVTIVCDNLFELWKKMCRNNNILNTCISLPKLLAYLARTNSNNVFFVLDELSEEYIKEEDAAQIKHLFTSTLKDSLVVFIPESISKNRELVANKHKLILQKNNFQEEIIGMKVLCLNKSMRVTECNKLLLDIAQKAISETKTVLSIPKTNIKLLQENERVKLPIGEDLQINKRKNSPIFFLIIGSQNDSANETKNFMGNFEKDNVKTNNMSYYDSDDAIKMIDNYYAPINIKRDNSFLSSITYDKTGVTDSNLDQSLKRIENKSIDTLINDFHDNDLDYMAKVTSKRNNYFDPNSYMETEYVFKDGNIGHSIKGEKPKVVYLPFYDIADKKSLKILSIVLEKLCFNVLKKTVVICNNMEDVQSVSYAIDIIKNFKAVPYSPHLQKYSPTLETKMKIKSKLINEMDILVTDCKGISGTESESVIVFVSPDEIYLRHALVDAISRSTSYLTVIVRSCCDNKDPFNNHITIRNVLLKWPENVIEKITVATSNNENQKSTHGIFPINEESEEFIDRGSTIDFEKYRENLQFQIFHENNFIYECMASNLSKQLRNDIEIETSNSSETEHQFSAKKETSSSPEVDNRFSAKTEITKSPDVKNRYSVKKETSTSPGLEVRFLANKGISKSPAMEKVFSVNKDSLSKSNNELFINTFYENQLSFTDIVKSIVDKREWGISINDRKTSYNTLCDSYFVNHFIKSGGKLSALDVNKKILSIEEKNLLIQCSANVRNVFFYCPVKLEGLKPINKIEGLAIYISNYLVTKKEFEKNFLPWIVLCEKLTLKLHDDIDFIQNVYEWICYGNIKWLSINYRGKYFYNLRDLKNFITKEKCLIS